MTRALNRCSNESGSEGDICHCLRSGARGHVDCILGADLRIEELIIRGARGEVSEEEERRLNAWRSESRRNEQRYRDVVLLVQLTGELEEAIDTTPVSAHAVVGEARARAQEDKVTAFPSPIWRRRSAMLTGGAVAAAVAAFLLAGIPDRIWDRIFTTVAEAPETTDFRTGPDSRRSIQLSDGILVHLGPSSRLNVSNAEPDPRIRLEGRAFFGVERQTDRRVVVETAGGNVTVVGTRFEVYSTQGNLELLVVDGRVGVSAGAAEVEVGSGEKSMVTQGVIEPPVEVEDPLAHLEWMGQAMVFQGTPIDKVAREIGLRYGVDVEVTDPALTERTLTAVFDGQPLEEVVRIVCGAVQARCDVEDRGDDRVVVIRAQ